MLLQCWNHTINAAKVWLKKHDACHAEIPAYVSHIRDLLNEPSYEDYEIKLNELKINWILEYFMKEIHTKVMCAQEHYISLHNIV